LLRFGGAGRRGRIPPNCHATAIAARLVLVGFFVRLEARFSDPAIAKNRGRIIKTTGDGMLLEE
jgi:glutamate formiminotransferase